MYIDLIAGARPNFMKIAPIITAIEKASSEGNNITYRLVHTGQHYDKKMSGNFFEELGIPEPHINLEAGGGTQAEQTAAIMIGYEKVLMAKRPNLVLVVGDVTSTMACTIAAKKLNNIKVAHVEAGIRSFDLNMPEEINRMLTDSVADFYFTTSEIANENLRNIGAKEEQIFFVGNTMIDTLMANMPRLRKPSLWDDLNLIAKEYFVITLHRPANVDEQNNLKILLQTIAENVNGLPILFPVHPRTAKILDGLHIKAKNLHIIEPLSYLEFNYLVKYSKAVITDSGGITEETTVMGVPCMTLRNNTERPETVTIGTNQLLGTKPEAVIPSMTLLFADKWKKGNIPKFWDGHTSERIVSYLLTLDLN